MKIQCAHCGKEIEIDETFLPDSGTELCEKCLDELFNAEVSKYSKNIVKEDADESNYR